MVTMLEFSKHAGEWDLDNSLQEKLEQLLSTVEKALEGDNTIKSVCNSLFPIALEVRQSVAVWFMNGGQEEMRASSAGFVYPNSESKQYPSLAKKVKSYLEMVTQLMVDLNLEQITQKMELLDLENPYLNELLQVYMLSSINFESCILIADCLLEGKVSKSEEWIEDVEGYFKTTLVTYLACSMTLDFIEIPEDKILENPILNRAKILKAEFAVLGTARIKSLLA